MDDHFEGSSAARGARHAREVYPRLREILDHAPAAVYVKDPHGRYVFANRWCGELLGVAPEALVGKTVDEVFPPDVAARTREREARAAAEGQAVTEDVFSTPDGERVAMTVRFPFRLRSGELGTFAIAIDITDRKRAQAEAEHASELLDLGDAFVEVGPDWRILRVNGRLERLARTPRRRAIGRSMWEVFPEAARPAAAYWRDLHRCMEERIPVQFVERYAPLDVWTAVSAYPTRDDGIVVFVRDATERMRTQQQLRDTLDRLTAHVSTTPLAVVEWGSDYRVTTFSPRAEQVLGWPAAEVIGKRIDEIPWVPQEDWPSVREVMRDMGSGARPTNVNANRNVRKDGSVVYCEWYNSALRDASGQLVSVLSLVLDVTERTAAEARAESLARIPRENPDPVIRLRADLTVDYANDASRHLLDGWRFEPGRPADPELAELARTAQASGRRFRAEIEHGSKWVSLHVVPMGGEVNVYGQDVSDRRRAEDALRAANARLVEADRRKDEFLGMLSHELRNPLAPIRTSVYILNRSAPGSAEAARARGVIQRQTDHLARLVDDLLDVTRIARGKIALRCEHADVAAVVRRTAEDHVALAAARGIALTVETPEAPAWAVVDPTRVSQIVGNLLQNAIKFTPAGGRVAVSVVADRGACVIRVSDTGPGVEPALLPALFEPFVQGDRSLARTQGGLGLGLALVKGLVELHGGSVSVASDGAGRGAVFTVRLPLGEDATAPGPPP